MSAMTNKTVDFNSLLIGANLLVVGLLFYALAHAEPNRYVNRESILLGIVLCGQTHFALWLERRQRDPFVIVLAFTMIFYYSLRIFTLSVYDFSDVFDRFPYDVTDTNFALVFILIANLFLYFGLYVVKLRDDRAVDASGWDPSSSTRIVLLLVAAIFFAYFNGASATDADAESSRLLSVLGIFLTPNIIVLMALAYFFLFRRTLKRSFAITLATLIAIELIVHTLTGSRSAIVVIVQNCILVWLAMAGRIRIRRKVLLISLALLPLFLMLLVVSFAVSTYNRATRIVGTSFDVQKAFVSAMESASGLSIASTLDIVLPPLLSRAGYFDYSAEVIAHRQQYRSALNLSSYGKSIVDNILTPGFDVYDQPKISNALHFIYGEMGRPSKEASSEDYQSDQLGVYGEFFGLFGYGCLPILFAGAYLLKRTYAKMKSANPFIRIMKRVVMLYVFDRIINSYGIDWVIGETIPLVTAVFIYTFFFSIRRSRMIEAPGQVPPEASKPLTGLPAASR
jgi:hypothetical protein